MSWTIKIIGLFFIIVANGLFRLGIVNTVLHFSGYGKDAIPSYYM